MHLVTKDQVGIVEGKRELVAEASEIGLSPGEWPEFIAVVDESAEGFLFQRVYILEGGGYRYQTKNGAVNLTVFND